MKNNSGNDQRRSIRLKGYDYSRAGIYFVTICSQNRAFLFGNVADGNILLNDAGRMIEKWYIELENKYPNVRCDQFVCMPNHVHFIIFNVGADLCVRPDSGAHAGAPLPEIVQWFKTMTTNEYIRCVKQHGWPPFAGKLWQRNYYEHIVRSENELNRIREYITNNPKQWESDRENPGGRSHAIRNINCGRNADC
jgi:REP-associated tyrosine transposase